MFEWFRRKPPESLEFESNQAAFDHACRNGDYPVLLEALIPALVIREAALDPDGVRHFLLRLADRNGGRELWSCTLQEAPAYPQVGDLVGFKVVKIASDLPDEASILGYIAVQLAAVLVQKRGWRIARSYTPPNLKPTLRW